MKQTFLILTFILQGFIFFSCKKEVKQEVLKEVETSVEASQSLTSCPEFSDDFDSCFNNVGDFHNALLTNLHDNYEKPDSIQDYLAFVEDVKEFTRSYFISNQSEYFESPVDEEEISSFAETSKHFINSEVFVTSLNHEDSIFSFSNILTELTEPGLIDDFNTNLFLRIANLVNMNINGELTDISVYSDSLTLYKDLWLANNFESDCLSSGKFVTGYAIHIGLKSAEWWEAHPDAHLYEEGLRRSQRTMVAPPIWALDAAGALLSGGFALANQYTASGNVNWQLVGGSAVLGGGSASGGVVGKVAKWIKNLF